MSSHHGGMLGAILATTYPSYAIMASSRVAWCTDIHLDFLSRVEKNRFYRTLCSSRANALFVTGDIADSHTLPEVLGKMAATAQCNIYFVLGNHDFYGSSVHDMEHTVRDLCVADPRLHHVPHDAPYRIAPRTVLVGVNGWADARYGDYDRSNVITNDSTLIQEFREVSQLGGRLALKEIMQRMADSDALALEGQLHRAVASDNVGRVIVLTHVPPFQEATLYNGKMSDPHHMPFFSCKAVGDVLVQVARAHTGIHFDVYCGHSHGEACHFELPNLHVRVGGAEYGRPVISSTFFVE